ncbi:hypothetical protein DFA_09297 [Cavenderia fasciculata]|uniref:Uncharacterized protein n=1 Tax=Cavenderia fasciculata TaxID=261658 RepID=F4Q785_CACFS|nr:uncharacterized protein DFA_09297 [Cavenderia fasciculata]EGG16267.1 hypothetical protein DFA_09297 [Cavenderia fasciculata]|eukprot:XP_004354651.1 hypothetical protein DFA_09297 [Cavenderia fasciculata]
MIKYKYLSIIITLLILSIVINNHQVVHAIQCIRDQRLFQGDEVAVDWWFIHKLRGFSDTYLYFDSLMGEEDLKVGRFLRSKNSALGATMIKIDKTVTYLAFNDQVTKKMKSSFKINAHEKGIIAWDKGQGEDGIYIHHSMPNFPNSIFEGRRVSHETWASPYMEDDQLIDDKFSDIFPFLGWHNNFFPTNVMSQTSLFRNGHRDLVTKTKPQDDDAYVPPGEEPEEEDLDHEIDTDEKPEFDDTAIDPKRDVDSTLHPISRNHSNKSKALDINPYALSMENKNVFGQHLFCLTLFDANSKVPDKWSCEKDEDNPPPPGEDTMIGLFLKFLARGSGNGITYTHSYGLEEDDKKYLKFRPDDHYSTEFEKQCFQFKNQPFYFATSTLKRHQEEDGMVSIHSKYSDVWGILEEPCNQDNLQERPCLGQGEKLWISTWRGSNKVDTSLKEHREKLQLATFAKTFTSNEMEQTITWGRTSISVSGSENAESFGTTSDHSKFAYLFDDKKDRLWNIAISGGNLHTYNPIKDKYQGSNAFLICFASNNLANALENIRVKENEKVDVKKLLWTRSTKLQEFADIFNKNLKAIGNAMGLESELEMKEEKEEKEEKEKEELTSEQQSAINYANTLLAISGEKAVFYSNVVFDQPTRDENNQPIRKQGIPTTIDTRTPPVKRRSERIRSQTDAKRQRKF